MAWWSRAPCLLDAAHGVPLSVVAILLLEFLHPSLQIGMLTDLPDEITERGPLTVREVDIHLALREPQRARPQRVVVGHGADTIPAVPRLIARRIEHGTPLRQLRILADLIAEAPGRSEVDLRRELGVPGGRKRHGQIARRDGTRDVDPTPHAFLGRPGRPYRLAVSQPVPACGKPPQGDPIGGQQVIEPLAVDALVAYRRAQAVANVAGALPGLCGSEALSPKAIWLSTAWCR